MILGLTGGIGSGKSTVARLFSLLGWAHFNSDEVAKALYFEEPVRKHVIALLGEEAYLDKHKLNKSFISERVFKDPETLRRLNDILHPAVGEKFKNFVANADSGLILKESALLFEAGLTEQADRIVLVVAPDALRMERVLRRDLLTADQVKARMQAQWTQEEKMKGAHFIVHNDEQHSLIEQVTRIHEDLLKTNRPGS